MRTSVFVFGVLYSFSVLAEQQVTLNNTAFNNASAEQSISFIFKDTLDIDDSWYLMIDTEFFTHRDDTSHLNPREFKLQYEADKYGISLGYDTIFWGVSETYNPVDILNRKNILTGYDGKDKHGELMLSGSYFFAESTLSGYILPRFDEQQYLDIESVSGMQIRSHHEEQNNPTYGLRYATTIDAIDLGLSYVHGTSREPFLISQGNNIFDAQYPAITQYGIDAQYTTETTLYKLEYASRESNNTHAYLANVGLEYIFVTDIEISAILELMRSDFSNTIYQNDIMLGSRFDFANESGTEGIISLIYDRDYSSMITTLSMSSRIEESTKIEFDVAVFNADAEDTLLNNQKDSASITLHYYF